MCRKMDTVQIDRDYACVVDDTMIEYYGYAVERDDDLDDFVKCRLPITQSEVLLNI